MSEASASSGGLVIQDAGGSRSWVSASFLAMTLLQLGYDVRRFPRNAPQEDSDEIAGGSYLVLAPSGTQTHLEDLHVALRALQADSRLRRRLEGAEVLLRPHVDGIDGTQPVRVPRVAIYGGAGAPYHYLDIFLQAGFHVLPVASPDVRSGALDACDVLAVPGGGWEHMNGQLGRLGREGADAIRRFVEGGGTYLSSCAGTYNVLTIDSRFEAGWHPAHLGLPKLSARSWLTNPEHAWGLQSPGIGVIRAEVQSPDHPLTLGVPSSLETVYYNGPLLEPTNDGLRPLLACTAPIPERFTPGERLFGATTPEATWMEQACAEGLLGGAFQPLGEGWLVGFGLHPEFGTDPEMLDWGRPALLLANAALWAAQRDRGQESAPDLGGAPIGGAEIVARGQAALEHIADRLSSLHDLPLEPVPEWLEPSRARAAFGLDPVTLWRGATRGGAERCGNLVDELRRWKDLHDRAAAQARGSHEHTLRRALEQSRLLLSRDPLEADQDLGFKGLLALLDETKHLLETETAGGERSPYRAVAMSYLSASGYLTAAQLLVSGAIAVLEGALVATALPPASHVPQERAELQKEAR